MTKNEFIELEIENGCKIRFLNLNGELMLGIYLGSDFSNENFSFRNYSSGNTEAIYIDNIHSLKIV